MKKSNIVIAGFMASGKTTVGRLLEELTGKGFIDTDKMIEEKAGMSVAEIFEKSGEEHFRRLELDAVSEVASLRNSVIAVGGGAVLDGRNRRELKRNGVVYLLKVSPGEAARRAGSGVGRPLLGADEAEIERLMSSRESAYLDAADVVFETAGLGPRDLALRIAKDFEERAANG